MYQKSLDFASGQVAVLCGVVACGRTWVPVKVRQLRALGVTTAGRTTVQTGNFIWPIHYPDSAGFLGAAELLHSGARENGWFSLTYLERLAARWRSSLSVRCPGAKRLATPAAAVMVNIVATTTIAVMTMRSISPSSRQVDLAEILTYFAHTQGDRK